MNKIIHFLKMSFAIMLAGAGGFGLFTWGYDRGEKFALVGIEAAESKAFDKGKSEAISEITVVHQNELAQVRLEGKEEGYKLGSADQVNLNTSQDAQTLLIARLLAIIQSPASAAGLSTATNDALSDVSEAVRRNDFAAASELLPPEISYATDSECVKPEGLFIVLEDQRFNICGTNEVFIVTNIQYGAIDFSVDGEGLRLSYARREPFSDNCFVAYERRFETDEVLTAEVRFGCK